MVLTKEKTIAVLLTLLPREVKILEYAETMGDRAARSERSWQDVTSQFWTL
jgi:hypothetical protein